MNNEIWAELQKLFEQSNEAEGINALPKHTSFNYKDWGIDNVELKYEDPDGNLIQLLNQNRITISENGIDFWDGELIPDDTSDTITMTFSPWENGTVIMTTDDRGGGKEGWIPIWGELKEYIIKDWIIISEKSKLSYKSFNLLK